MIVLERVAALHAKHEHVLDDLVMDVLRVLASPDMEVRRKALAIALSMVGSRNVEEVVGFLKKELVRTLDGQFEKVSVGFLSSSTFSSTIFFRKIFFKSLCSLGTRFRKLNLPSYLSLS